MKTIQELVKIYGTQKKLAEAMGVFECQVNRWKKNGALVSPLTGEVYILTKRVNVLLGDEK